MKTYVPGLAVTWTTNGAGGPASGAPLLTTELPSKSHLGAGTGPQVNEVGVTAGRLSSEWVVPLGFSPVSSVSSRVMPFACASAFAVSPAGRTVKVWKPSLTNSRSLPVRTLTVRGKKSLKLHSRPAGTAAGWSAVTVATPGLAAAGAAVTI